MSVNLLLSFWAAGVGGNMELVAIVQAKEIDYIVGYRMIAKVTGKICNFKHFTRPLRGDMFERSYM